MKSNLFLVLAVTVLMAGLVTENVAAAEPYLHDLQSRLPLHERYEIGEMRNWVDAVIESDESEIREFISTVCKNGYLYENHFILILALQRLADVLNQSDRDPLTLMTLGSQTCSLVGASYTGTLESLVFNALAVVTPQELLDWATSDPSPSDTDLGLYNQALHTLAGQMPAIEILDRLDSLSESDQRLGVESFVLLRWADQDPTAAIIGLNNRLERLKELEDELAQGGGKSEADETLGDRYQRLSVARHQYQSTLNHAIDQLGEAASDVSFESLEHLLSEHQLARLKLSKTKMLLRKDPREAFDLFIAEADLAGPQHTRNLQEYEIYNSIVRNWAETDSVGMLEYISANDPSEDQRLTTIAHTQVLQQLAQTAPQEAMQRAVVLSISESQKLGLTASIFNTWIRIDPMPALSWLETNSTLADKTQLLPMLASQLPFRGASGHVDLDLTQQVYDRLPVEQQRQSIEGILGMLIYTPSEDAEAWIAGLTASEGITIANNYLGGMRIEKLSQSDPLAALYQAGDYIGFNAARVRGQSFHMALDSHPQEVLEWLQSAPISENERENLTRQARDRGFEY